MLQQDTPEDFVLATGEMHYVREFVEKAFRVVGVEIRLAGWPEFSTTRFNQTLLSCSWSGKGVDEVGKDSQTGRILVRVDPKYFRPAEVE